MFSITEDDKIIIDKKLQYQKDFLKNFIFDINKKEINMLDNTYSANINPKKYFSEVNNRVNSLSDYAKSLNLHPVFITITAPSLYHKKDEYNNLIISPNETSKYLSKLFNRFTSLQVVRQIKEYTGQNLIYFRVYEPHKSGVPHLHAMLYLPKNFIIPLKKKFKEHFNKYNIFQLDYKYTWYSDKGGAVAYMMKYITKTFKNAVTGIIDTSAYWYMKYRIIRFNCSRTLVPLFIYRKSRYYFKNVKNSLIYISSLYKKGIIKKMFNNTLIIYHKYNKDDDNIDDLIIYNKFLIYELNYNINKSVKLSYKKQIKPSKPIKLIIDNLEYINVNNSIVTKYDYFNKPKPYCQYDDYELLKAYDNFNLDDNLHKLGVIKKELVKRQLIPYEVVNINDYNTSFNGF